MNNASNSVKAEQNNVHVDFAAAFVRGRLIQGDSIPSSQELTECDLDRLTTDQKYQIYRAGEACGLRLTKFKRTMGLARVNKVLGILRSLTPTSLLDVGSVPVLHRGMVRERSEITALLGPSAFIGTDFKGNLARVAMSSSQSFDDICSETDLSGMMEGLYIKVENDSHVLDRLKFVRADFHAVVDQSGSHWIDRPMLKNQLA